MSLPEAQILLEDLEADGVRLRAVDDKLHYRARRGALTERHKQRILALKDDLLRLARRRARRGLAPPVVPDAEAVWLPTVTQAGAVEWPIPLQMPDVRRWRNVDPAEWQIALNCVIARHAILRTHYTRDSEGRLWAVTERERIVAIENIDLSTLAAARRCERLDEIVAARFHAPLDPWKGPMLRFALVRLDAEVSASIFVASHSVIDGYSQDIFFRDLLEFCRAARAGESPILPPQSRQFRDLALMQNELVDSEAGDAHFLSLHEKLLGRRRTFSFPADPGPPVSCDVPTLRGQIDGALLSAFRKVVQSSRATTCAAVLVATGIALCRWAGSEDAHVWVVTSGRTDADFESLIGCCARHAPFAMCFDSGQTFRQALQETWKTYAEDAARDFPGQLLGPALRRRQNGLLAGIELNFRTLDWFRHFDWAPGSSTSPAQDPAHDQYLRLRGPENRLDDVSVFALRFVFLELEQRIEWGVRHRRGAFSEAAIERLSALVAGALKQLALQPDDCLCLRAPSQPEGLPSAR
jgi:hypothetical protein